MAKIAMFTDIHFGAKGNSQQHLQDCMDYIDWFCENATKNSVDYIVFLGDWMENRNAINVNTLNVSQQAARKLNSLGLPVFFIVGNHDLYHRGNRNIFSTDHFNDLNNFVVIDEIVEHENLLFFPFLFNHEYPAAAGEIQKRQPSYVFGHFEFRDFVVTGTDRRMDHGPDHSLFKSPTYIFSGHFHKRQIQDNVVYIGNTFPTNYGDAWDDQRGMAILDTATSKLEFLDWADCPRYCKVKLSDLLSEVIEFPEKCRVRCTFDIDIGYSEAQMLKDEMTKTMNLREFVLEENIKEKKDAISGGDEDIDDFNLNGIDDTVFKLLKTGIIGTTTISPDKLIEIYQTL